MSTHPVIVEIISENYTKTVELDCSWSANAWEVTKLLSHQLSEEEHRHGGENSVASGTIVLRDQHGTRIQPNNKINAKKGAHLIAEILEEGGVQGIDKAKRSKGGVISMSIIPAEDSKEIDLTGASKANAGKKNARSPSPKKNKRRKTDDGDSDSQPDSPPSSPSSVEADGGDADWRAEIQTKQKRKRSILKNEHTITNSSDGKQQQESQCEVCGGAAGDSPTLRLRLKRRLESDQSPSRVNLRLRQRSCTMCSGDRQEGAASSEQGRKTRNSKMDPVVVMKRATVEELGSSEKKYKGVDANAAKEDKLSCSLRSIHLGDNSDKPERSSFTTASGVRKKSGQSAKKSQSAVTSKEMHTVELTAGNDAMNTDGNRSQGKSKDTEISLGKPVDASSKCSETGVDKDCVAAIKDTASSKNARNSTETPVGGKRKGGKTMDTDVALVDLVNTDSEYSEAAISREAAASKKDTAVRKIAGDASEKPLDSKRKGVKTKNTNIPVTEHFDRDGKHSETVTGKVMIAASQDTASNKHARDSTAKRVDCKRKGGKTKDTDLTAVERVDTDGKNFETGINKKTTVKNDTATFIHKNAGDSTEKHDSTEKPIEVNSRYLSPAVDKTAHVGVSTSSDRKHSGTKSVDTKKSTGKTVDNDMRSSASINKIAEKSTDKLLDIGRKNSQTPVKTADSRQSSTQREITVKNHGSPALVNEHGPTFMKVSIEQAGVDEADGLCKSSPASGVDAEDSFINDVDVDAYEEHNSVPVEIGDSHEWLKDVHSVSDGGDPVVVTIGRNELKRFDLETLEEGEWLNDCVINAYFCLLTEASQLSIFTHSSFFFFSLYKRGYEGVQRWTKNVDLFAQDLIFIPIHNKSHWTLVVVHVKQGVIEYYNSSTILDGYPRSMMHIRDYLLAEALHRGKTAFCEASWEMYILDQIPRQQNMDDCGLFICQYAKKLSLKQKVSFDIETTTNLRRQMLRELLRSNIEEH